MNISVDIRCLMSKQRTGVGEYTYEFLNALFSIDPPAMTCRQACRAGYTDDKIDFTDTNQYFLFYNSQADVSKNIPKWERPNVHYVYTRWPNKLLNLLVWLKIIKVDKWVISKFQNFKISKFDVWFSPNLNFTNLSKNIKHILTIHDLSFKFFSECFTFKSRWWHRFLNPQKQCQRAEVILAPSENTKRDIADSYQIAEGKIRVLRPGLAKNFKFHPESSSGSEFKINEIRKKYNLPEKYILYLGTIEPRKNIEAIAEAFKRYLTPPYPPLQGEGKTKFPPPMRGRQEGVSLVIAGAKGWKNKKILKLISQTPGARYIGYVDEADKPALYQSAILFVYPSLYEGFGFPVLEAMASGVPVITSNRSSLPEVAGDAAYLVNPHNAAEITEAMRLILSDEKLRGLLIERGKKQTEKFKWEETAKRFVELLNC